MPVPLHWKKERLRGYNQSTLFGEGLADVLNARLITHQLIRRSSSSSLTTMSRWERMETMQTVFEIKNPRLFVQKHVVLVDDVMTTGATIEACALQVLRAEPASIRMLTLATGEI